MEHPFCSMLYTPREFSEDNFKLLKLVTRVPAMDRSVFNGRSAETSVKLECLGVLAYTNRAQIGTALFDANYFNGRKKDLENFVGAN
jgi:hypothetical protein